MLARPGRSPSASWIWQRLLVPALGRLQIAPVLRHHAELVVGAGQAGPVAERLLDLQRLLVPALGRREIAPLLRHHAELVVGHRQTPVQGLVRLGADRRLQALAEAVIGGVGRGEVARP